MNKQELVEWVKKARANAPSADDTSWNSYKTGYSDAMAEVLEKLTGEFVVFLT